MEPVLSECIQGKDINTDVVEEERVVANCSALGGADLPSPSLPVLPVLPDYRGWERDQS